MRPAAICGDLAGAFPLPAGGRGRYSRGRRGNGRRRGSGVRSLFIFGFKFELLPAGRLSALSAFSSGYHGRGAQFLAGPAVVYSGFEISMIMKAFTRYDP